MSEMSAAEIIKIAKLMRSAITGDAKALDAYTNFPRADAELLNVAYQLMFGGGSKPLGFTGTDPDQIARCLAVAKEIGTVREFTLVFRTNPISEPEARIAWRELGRSTTPNNQPLPEATAEQTPVISFMSELPHNDSSRPLAAFKANQDETYYYYEHPKSIGAVNGLKPAYEYPQVMVVTRGQDPVLIVRSEKNPSGALFLCSLDARGTHTNWGQISPMNRDNFVKQADKIVMQIKHDTAK